MKNLELDYENKREVKNYINSTVVPSILEVLVDDYDFNTEDYDNDNLYDHVWEIINGLSDVIYNYQAKKVSEAFDFDVFGHDDITGERYTSYNQIAFTIIYNQFNEKYSDIIQY